MAPHRTDALRSTTPSSKSHQDSSREYGMSPASRYNHNLKVLRRRDPSIVSIFDQFSHVCVYHHNGNSWEKQGYEGSMFLYERDSYPPYGFYILNRMGMDDYIQRLYPEDDVGAHGSYLMLRHYPDFTSHRLAQIPSSSSTDKFSPVYSIPDLSKLTPSDKGRWQIRGLWMFATDAREPMIDVMLRLHSYIKKNQPYPEQYRYGPGRPPPPNPHLSTDPSRRAQGSTSASVSSASDNDTSSEGDSIMDISTGSDSYLGATSKTVANGSSSTELDKLFARLGNNKQEKSLPSPSPSTGSTTSKMTVESLFAALSGTDSPPKRTSTPPPVNRGIALLDTIFASASNPKGSTDRGSGKVLGDVTPRPIARSELQAIGGEIQVKTRPQPAAQPIPASLSRQSVLSTETTTPAKTPTTRPLVPFEADSELWPYPRPPLDDRSDEIVELDFSDTSALSDLDKFEAKVNQKDKGKRVKKGRRERQQDREREREAIENSWDVPTPVVPPPPVPVAISNGQKPPTQRATVTTPSTNGTRGHTPALDRDSTRDALVTTASAHLQAKGHIEKNVFVREVLTLIHTDKAFVDALWQDYMSRTR